jgi:outer membrane protein OmpA-like peptidoglycan-associated protein
MGKKIIKLTESELYNIVKRVLREQDESEDNSYYTIGASGLNLKIIDGKLYQVSLSEDRKIEPIQPLNGVLYDFKYNVKTDEVIDEDYIDNINLTTENFQAIKNSDAAPNQTKNLDFVFLAIVPNDASSKNAKVGTPMVYGASVMEFPGDYFKGDRRYQESKDGIISAKMYYRTRGKAYLINFYPGKYNTSYISNKSDVTPIDEPIELNIESPFKFDSIQLTDMAQSEFNDFIQSIKTNYSNVTGDVEVISSASIDGDPEGKVASGQKRTDYDMDLSKKRAHSIVSILKNNLPETKLNFIPNGIGETDQFASGKKWPEVKDTNQTAPNRRLIIKLPQIMKQQ